MDELQLVKEALVLAENEAVRKDQQISELLSRMREYEMGEYGLADAVCEIKECRKAIRARDREIENLTHEVNRAKLEVSELKEQNRNLKEQFEITENEFSIFLTEKSSHSKKTRKSKKHKTVENSKPSVLDKAIQCHRTTFTINHAEELYASRVQNEKLRIELKKVCQEATDSILELQKQHREDCLKNEDIIQNLRDNTQFRNTILMSVQSGNESDSKYQKAVENKMNESTEKRINDSDKHHYILDPEAYYKMILTHINGENSEVEKMLSELSNQIRVLKNNQILLVRRYMALSDAEDILRKENDRLKRAFAVNQERNQIMNMDVKYKMSNECTAPENGGVKLDRFSFLPCSSSNDSAESCNKSRCIANTVRVSELVELEIELLEEMSHIKKLLEISRHQTRALETVCFSQEIELKAIREQFILFQIQSDERMILGKLAMKVLQLQFSNAACIYELKKYKLDNEALEGLCSTLQKDYEENEKRLSMSYLEAHMKIKSLTDVLQDLCRRCNEAVSTFVNPEHETE